MTLQRLELQKTATFTASPQEIVFTFPPVPQGLTWTGSLAFSVALGLGPDLQGVVWTVYRNGMPVLSWQEFGVASDVQATSGEVISVVGVYVGSNATLPAFEIHCTWTGYSDDAYSVAPAVPWVSGSNRGLVQVYNGLGPGRDLAVSQEPQPTAVQRARAFAGTPGTTQDIMAAVSGTAFKLWELGMHVSVGQLSTTAGVKFVTVTIQTKNASLGLLQGQMTTVPAAVDSSYLTLPMYGYTLAAGDTLQLVAGAYGGDNFAAAGHVVYST